MHLYMCTLCTVLTSRFYCQNHAVPSCLTCAVQRTPYRLRELGWGWCWLHRHQPELEHGPILAASTAHPLVIAAGAHTHDMRRVAAVRTVRRIVHHASEVEQLDHATVIAGHTVLGVMRSASATMQESRSHQVCAACFSRVHDPCWCLRQCSSSSSQHAHMHSGISSCLFIASDSALSRHQMM